MVLRCGVIGNPIEHSLSPFIHHEFAKKAHMELIYEKITGDDLNFENQVSAFFRLKGKGLNITSPFKTRAFMAAQVKTARCNLAGAANTLWMDNNQLHADNTDGIGLVTDLNRYLKLAGKHVLILGAGGAVRGIIPALLSCNLGGITVANRNLKNKVAFHHDFPLIHFTHMDTISGCFDLIINATSASLEGNTIILPTQVMREKPFCYDLAYQRHVPTPFVFYAREQGCGAIDGLGMLVEQAAESFYIWHEIRPYTAEVIKLLRT
ncbi:MAG: shikimate dehydrogenase [bacterium]|nr:shikimate dehydrogenase [bacterium]